MLIKYYLVLIKYIKMCHWYRTMSRLKIIYIIFRFYLQGKQNDLCHYESDKKLFVPQSFVRNVRIAHGDSVISMTLWLDCHTQRRLFMM